MNEVDSISSLSQTVSFILYVDHFVVTSLSISLSPFFSLEHSTLGTRYYLSSTRDDTSNSETGWCSDRTIHSRAMRAPTSTLQASEEKSHAIVFDRMLHLLNDLMIYFLWNDFLLRTRFNHMRSVTGVFVDSCVWSVSGCNHPSVHKKWGTMKIEGRFSWEQYVLRENWWERWKSVETDNVVKLRTV